MLSFIHRSLVVILPKISNYTRTRIELLYNQGFHPAGIFKTLKSEGLQVSLSGITRLIKKLRLTGSAANLPRLGRPKKLSVEARAFRDQQMRRNDETTSAKIRKKLAKRGILVSSSTVRRSLMTMIRTGLCFVFSGIKPNLKSLFLRVFLIVCIRDLTPAEDLSCIS